MPDRLHVIPDELPGKMQQIPGKLTDIGTLQKIVENLREEINGRIAQQEEIEVITGTASHAFNKVCSGQFRIDAGGCQ